MRAPFGVAVDDHGNVVIADFRRIRVVAARTGTFYGTAMTVGHIYTVGGRLGASTLGDGGPATSASLGTQGVAVDGGANLVVADGYNNRVRLVAVSTNTFYGIAMNAGDIYTIAGNGQVRFSGDGDLADAAEMNHPWSVAVGPNGDVVAADSENSRVRVVAAHTETTFGLPVTAGDIVTVAGNGEGFFDGHFLFPDGELAVSTPGRLHRGGD